MSSREMDCRGCDGLGVLDELGEVLCLECDGAGTDPVWRQGHAARTAGRTRTDNPYKVSTDMERWAAGWQAAEAAIGSGAPR